MRVIESSWFVQSCVPQTACGQSLTAYVVLAFEVSASVVFEALLLLRFFLSICFWGSSGYANSGTKDLPASKLGGCTVLFSLWAQDRLGAEKYTNMTYCGLFGAAGRVHLRRVPRLGALPEFPYT